MTTFVVTIRILATVLPALGIALTSLRLYYRWTRRHLGWDDAWAAVTMVCAFFLTAGAWTRSDTPQTGPFHHGPRVRILGYYMLNVAFTCVLWAARLSILFSTIRLIPYMMRLRLYAYMAAVLFGCMWAALLILKITICETRPAWKQSAGVQCVLGSAVAAVELTTDFVADLILVVMPMRLLWRISLTVGRRALLTGIFSASIFTTIVSIVHGVYVFSSNRNAEGIWAHILASTAMIVANLAVLVTWFMRALGHGEDSQGPPSNRSPGTGGNDQSPAKNLSSIHFNHGVDTSPIVLRTLDNRSSDPTALAKLRRSDDESMATMTFAASGEMHIKTDVDASAYPAVDPQR